MMRKECVIVKQESIMQELYVAFELEQAEYESDPGKSALWKSTEELPAISTAVILTDSQIFEYIKDELNAGYVVKCVEQADVYAMPEWYMPLKKAVQNAGQIYIYIWRYEASSPFAFGRTRKPVKTVVQLSEYEVIRLHGGWPAIIIEEGAAKGVYELTSGGMVGDTVEQVNKDIDACNDMKLMTEQIAEARYIRDKKAMTVTNSDFGID